MKNKIILYHGSSQIIEKPTLNKGKVYNDYGQGFYLTEFNDLAKERAVEENKNGYSNKYELDLTYLKILDLRDEKYNVLNWLAILLDNRIFSIKLPTQIRGKEYLMENYLIDYKDYDLIIGYRADDSYFRFARSFIDNTINIEELSLAMKLGKLGIQYCLKSEKAFNKLKFLGYEISEASIFYNKKKKRNEDANKEFIKILEDNIKSKKKGIYLSTLIDEENNNE